MSINKILVVGAAWVGDMVLAQSLFKLIKRRDPGIEIDVLAPPWTLPLLQRMPEVHEALQLPFQHGQLKLAARYRLARTLRDRSYDQAIVLPNSLKSALIPFWAKIPLRTGYVGEWRWGLLNDARYLDKIKLPMTVQRFVALGLEKGAALPSAPLHPHLAVTGSGVEMALTRLNLERPAVPVLALCPGAEYGPAKRWPVEYYAEIARVKLAQGWQVWLFGSEKDSEITAALRALAGPECVDLAGRTTLAEAIDLLSLADLAVSNDSGLMHVAAALGRRLVAIYGSSDPGFTPPLSAYAKVQWLGLSCSPCFQRECPLGHLNCLRELKPEQVVRAMGEVTVI